MTTFRWVCKICLWVWVVFLGIADLEAQKVAVVLSGGGAKGSAHIGVLRALEEHHIPIDYIVGTSIGAVIGGMYSCGYSPQEIEQIISSEEFQRWAAGISDDKYNFYYLKEEPNASWVTTHFDFNRKLTTLLPTQLVKTYEIDLQMMQIFATANAAARGNFDSLMIPFRCLVSDIDSSRATILKRGDLSSSIRGSMSIPLIFNPLEINNRIVFDGGIYNNFPSDVALKEFTPDVIIGSRVAHRYHRPDRDDVLSQLLTMLMERQNDTMTFSRSVMIVPNIIPINLLDFSQVPQLADSGYAATLRELDQIKKLVNTTLPDSLLQEKRMKFRNKRPELLFDSIHVTGVTRAQADYFKKALKKGKPTIGFKELNEAYLRVISQGFIRIIYPQTRYNPKTGFFDLYLDITPANNYSVQFGGNFSLASTSEAFIELQYKYLWKNALRFYANGYVGRVYSSARTSGRIDFNSKLPWFVQLDYTYNDLNFFRNGSFFFDDKNPGYVLEREYFGKITSGIPASMAGKLVADLKYAFTNKKYFQDNQFSRNDTADHTTFDFFAPAVTYELNSLNRKQYPGSGARLMLKLSYINGIESVIPGSTAINHQLISEGRQWVSFRVIYDNYFQSLGPLKFGFYGEAVVSNQPLFSNFISSLLYASAFEPVPEAQTFFMPPFRATNYAAAGIKTIWKVYKKIECRLEGYLFQPYQEILQDPVDRTAYFGPVLSDHAIMATSALVYHSPLGPVSITVNYYDKMADPFTVNFNIGYLIFNERAMP